MKQLSRYIIPLLLIFEGVSSYFFNGSITKTIVNEGNYNIFYSLIFIILGLIIILGNYVLQNRKDFNIKEDK